MLRGLCSAMNSKQDRKKILIFNYLRLEIICERNCKEEATGQTINAAKVQGCLRKKRLEK